MALDMASDIVLDLYFYTTIHEEFIAFTELTTSQTI